MDKKKYSTLQGRVLTSSTLFQKMVVKTEEIKAVLTDGQWGMEQVIKVAFVTIQKLTSGNPSPSFGQVSYLMLEGYCEFSKNAKYYVN